MNPLRPLHLSHSIRHGDGGIAFAVADLLCSQQTSGIFSRWITGDQYPAIRRDSMLSSKIRALNPNIIHLHGLWRSHTRALRHISDLLEICVVAPHGMLDPWAMAHASWKKELVWSLWESTLLSRVGCLHALCHSEAVAIQRRLPGLPVAVIPNGVTNPPQDSPDPTNLPWFNHIESNSKVLLFFGRFHLKKGIEPLLTAWQSVAADAEKNDWYLILVGFGDDGKLLSQLNDFPISRCLAYDGVFGLQKAAVLHHSTAFILPSYSEGLPIAALEAMSYKLPCLLSSACNLPEALDSGAAILAEPDSSQLIKTLLYLFQLEPDHLLEMGDRGNQLTTTQFTWMSANHRSQQLYEWLLGYKSQPKFVRNNWGMSL